MVKLFCAIVGDAGSAFSVEVGEDQTVDDLKDAITEKNKKDPILKNVTAKNLKLFLAKTEENGWMTYDEDLVNKLLLNRVDTSKLKALWPTWKLNRAKDPQLFGEDVPLGEDVVHVLVRLPDEQSVPSRTRLHSEIEAQKSMKRLKTSEVDKWEWKEEEPVYSRDSRLFFVNREKAVKDLVKFHEANFYRAKLTFDLTWAIPLLDNMFGLGKSAFGQEYIRRCQSLKPDTTADEFMNTLCSCHTIRITLSQEHVLDKNGDFDSYLAKRSLVKRIRDFFQVNYDVLPRAFDNLKDMSLLVKLTKEVGPLFIVIDGISLTFNHNKLDDAARRERFFEFCKMLQPLFHNRKLFFLIAGRASFLNKVAGGPLGKDSLADSSPFKYERLHLHFLPPEAIKTVIENTRWEETSSESIQTHLELTDNEVENLSARLAETTFGHPRSLREAFKTCASYDELLNYMPEPPTRAEWEWFFEKLWLYRTPLNYLMEYALVRQEADLSASWIDDRCNEVTYEEMASVFDIAWEGSITNARLFMPGYIQKPILVAVFTVQELLEKVVPAMSHLSIDYPDVFEMLCLNRFQEMFPTEACPHEVLPSFFTEKQRFGRCRGVQFADRTFKMAEAGGIRGRASGLKLKSCPQSEPTNFLLSTQVQGMILTVGLAVKTCSTVTATLVDEEREKFDLLLSEKKGCLNVLFICATTYGGNLQEAFGSAKSVIYTEGMQSTEKKATTEYIHEVILLDLTTPQNRAEYFGLAWDDTLQTRLENVIHKGGGGNTAE